MGDEDGILLRLEGKQVVAFDLRLIVNAKSLSDLHKMIRHSSSLAETASAVTAPVTGEQDRMSRSIILKK